MRRKAAVSKNPGTGPKTRTFLVLFVILPGALAVAIVTTLGAALPVLPPERAASYVAVFAPAGAAGCVCGGFRAEEAGKRQGEGLTAFGVDTYFMPHEFGDRIASLPAIKATIPFLQYRFRDPADGHLFMVGGVHPRDTLIQKTNHGAGTAAVEITGFISGKRNRNKVLVNRAYARAQHLNTGDRLVIAGKKYIVSGIVDPGTQPTLADIYLPYTEAERMIADRLSSVPLTDQANVILVEIKAGTAREEAVREIESLFPDLVVVGLNSISHLTTAFWPSAGFSH